MIALISNRIINIEILRALAIVSVILIHMSMGHFYDLNLMSNDFFAWVTNNIYYTLTRFCVPVFLLSLHILHIIINPHQHGQIS